MNLLIVDDDPIIRRLLPVFCESFSTDWRALTARHGEEALEILAKERIDVLLTDVEMPVMDGCELVSRVKGLYPGMKVIVMSGLASAEARGRMRNAEVLKFIGKPFTAQELSSSISSAFSNGHNGMVNGNASFPI